MKLIKLAIVTLGLLMIEGCSPSGASEVNNHQGVKENLKIVEQVEDIQEDQEEELKYTLNKDWYNTEIASATLYMYAPYLEVPTGKRLSKSIITDNNKLNEYVLPSMTKELRPEDVVRLKKILSQEVPTDSGADTYEPYHGIVMKDSSGEISGYLSLCIPCGNYILQPHGGGINIKAISNMFEEYGFPVTRGAIYKKAWEFYQVK